jgi:hypothetical protein
MAPWSWILFEKPSVAQLLKNFPTFQGKERVHFCAHKNPPLFPILSQINPINQSIPFLSDLFLYPPIYVWVFLAVSFLLTFQQKSIIFHHWEYNLISSCITFIFEWLKLMFIILYTVVKQKVNLSLWLIKHYSKKTYEEVKISLHAFITVPLDWCEWADSRPGRFAYREKALGSLWTGAWVSLRAGLDAVT